VRVTICETTLDFSNVILPSAINEWYSSATTYDLSTIIPQITQTPNCNYNYDIQVLRTNTNGSGLFTGTTLSLPPEVAYDGITGVLSLEKCHDVGDFSTIDAECNSPVEPYRKEFELVVIVNLQNGLNN